MKKTEYTCDRCGEGISNYGTGWLTDGSLVIIEATTQGVADGEDATYHLHHICYAELLDWMEFGSDNADP